jgi:hypothetical protein
MSILEMASGFAEIDFILKTLQKGHAIKVVHQYYASEKIIKN